MPSVLRQRLRTGIVRAVIAVLGGSLTAIAWAFAILAGARASRSIGPWSTSGWVLLFGLALSLPLVVLDGDPGALDPSVIAWLGVAGVGYVAGMLLNYTALSGGKVAVVAAIVSTEGVIAATLSVLTGESLPGPLFILLALLAIGIFVAALEPGSAADAVADGAPARADEGPPASDPGQRLGPMRHIRAPSVAFAPSRSRRRSSSARRCSRPGARAATSRPPGWPPQDGWRAWAS
jgi:uncharacterized membrane protein